MERCIIFLKPCSSLHAQGGFLFYRHQHELLNYFFELVWINMKISAEVAWFVVVVGDGDTTCRGDELIHRRRIGSDYNRTATHGLDNIVAPAF